MSRVAVRAALGTALVLALAACTAAAGAAPARTPLEIGVLATSCEPERAVTQARAGVRLAVLDIAWDRYEPRPGEFDDGYAADVRRRVTTCDAAGIALVLGPGLQYPPGWVLGLPAGTYRNRAGETPDPPAANLVFSSAVRDAAARYLARLDADLGLERFRAVRIGTTPTGELGYPGPGPRAAFWAFDDAAQGGAGRAAGVAPSPLPGWAPGESVWRDAPVTPDQVTAWFRWYSDAVVSALAWQVDVLRGMGFAGDLHVPVAGRGTLPADLAAAVVHRLGSTGRDGALGRGLDYPAQFPALARLDAGPGRVVIDFAGLDDVSAVRARALDPPQDACRSDDVDTVRARSGEVALWSAQRWTTANARLTGLALVGENPGGPALAHTGGAPDSDSAAEQLRYAPRYAQDCGLTQFYWAFEETLYDEHSGVGVTDLETWMKPTT